MQRGDEKDGKGALGLSRVVRKHVSCGYDT